MKPQVLHLLHSLLESGSGPTDILPTSTAAEGQGKGPSWPALAGLGAVTFWTCLGSRSRALPGPRVLGPGPAFPLHRLLLHWPPRHPPSPLCWFSSLVWQGLGAAEEKNPVSSWTVPRVASCWDLGQLLPPAVCLSTAGALRGTPDYLGAFESGATVVSQSSGEHLSGGLEALEAHGTFLILLVPVGAPSALGCVQSSWNPSWGSKPWGLDRSQDELGRALRSPGTGREYSKAHGALGIGDQAQVGGLRNPGGAQGGGGSRALGKAVSPQEQGVSEPWGRSLAALVIPWGNGVGTPGAFFHPVLGALLE